MDYSDPNTDATYDTSYDTSYAPTYTTTNTNASISPVFWIIWLAVIVLIISSMWKVFTKAGQAGWKSLIPFYSTYVTLGIVNRPYWWLLLYFVPFVNLVVHIIVSIDLAKAFGKTTGFGVFGLVIFGIIGYPMLAFGNAKYTKPARTA